MNIEALVADPDSGLTIANIDAWVTLNATASAGDLTTVNYGALLLTIPTTSGGAATATQRKGSCPCVLLKGGVSGDRVPVRIAGRIQALVKSTANNAIEIGDRLAFGTVRALDADVPAVNTNRFVGWADEAFAVGSSSTAALKWVILAGPNGLGISSYTNATGIGT